MGADVKIISCNNLQSILFRRAIQAATVVVLNVAIANVGFGADAGSTLISGDNVRLRALPSAASATTRFLSIGTAVRELDRDGEWAYVQIDDGSNQFGWVHISYLDIQQKPSELLRCGGTIEGTLPEKSPPLRWSSTARRYSKGKYCISNVIEVYEAPYQMLVHWPVAQIEDAYISPTITKEELESALPSVMDGEIFYGLSNARVSAKAYRSTNLPQWRDEYFYSALSSLGFFSQAWAQDSPAEVPPQLAPADETWTTVDAHVRDRSGEVPFYLSFSVRSWYRDVSDGARDKFEYGYDLVNKGDPIEFVWGALKNLQARGVINDDRAAAVRMEGKHDLFSTSFLSPEFPRRSSTALYIISHENQQLLRIQVATIMPR